MAMEIPTLKEKLRKEFKKKLELPGVRVSIVECICPESIIVQRLGARKKGYSDADFSIYKRMKKAMNHYARTILLLIRVDRL
jgi:predicted kinase